MVRLTLAPVVHWHRKCHAYIEKGRNNISDMLYINWNDYTTHAMFDVER